MADVEFEFSQISPRDNRGREIYGILIDGTAYLESANDPGYGDEHQFYVDAVEILGGLVITRKQANASPNGFNGILFKTIASEIENDKTTLGQFAAREFADAVDAEKEPA